MPSECEAAVSTTTGVANLEGFTFKEVLNSDITRKSIFVLLEKEGKDAILICDKQPFAESPTDVEQWIQGSEMNIIVQNDVYGNYDQFIPAKLNGIKATLIYPANERLLIKYKRQNRYLIAETGEDYETITLPHILECKLSVQWVYNCLDHKCEQDRLIFEDPDDHNGFQLYPDLKWNGETMENLYCQAIVRRRGIKSVRDLKGDDVTLLENVMEKSKKALRDRYGLNPANLKAYFHYQPSFYHLHIHMVRLGYDAPGGTMYALPVETVIGNLRIAGDYYKRATLPFVGKALDPLCQKFKMASMHSKVQQHPQHHHHEDLFFFGEDYRECCGLLHIVTACKLVLIVEVAKIVAEFFLITFRFGSIDAVTVVHYTATVTAILCVMVALRKERYIMIWPFLVLKALETILCLMAAIGIMVLVMFGNTGRRLLVRAVRWRYRSLEDSHAIGVAFLFFFLFIFLFLLNAFIVKVVWRSQHYVRKKAMTQYLWNRRDIMHSFFRH